MIETHADSRVGPGAADVGHVALRLVVGGLLAGHGAQKLFGWFDGQTVELASLMGLAGIIEFVGGILILIGLFTRITAFITSGEMAVAYFMAHFSRAPLPINNNGEHTVLFCFIFLYLVFAGAGAFSVDRARSRGDTARATT